MLKSSSNCIISSTVSNESAPKSSMNLASAVILASSTPNLSITISLILIEVLIAIFIDKNFAYPFINNRSKHI